MSQPRIVEFPEAKLIGMNLSMSFMENLTSELWRSFMPRRKEIGNAIGNELFSVQVFSSPHDFSDPNQKFLKWAAVPVSDFSEIPHGMQTLTIPSGNYAVFHYKGLPSEGAKIFGYIFGQWLPQSGFSLDDRPHFEILGEKYKNDSVDSEEEIWIPVRGM